MYVKNKFLLSMFFKLPDEVCVIRRKRSLKIRQVVAVCCSLVLIFKKMHLDAVDFKKKRAEERAKESQNAKEEKL